MEWIAEHWDDIAEGGAALLAVVSVIVRLTPTPTDDQWLRKAMAWLSFLAPLDTGRVFSRPGKLPERGES